MCHETSTEVFVLMDLQGRKVFLVINVENKNL